MEYLYKEDIFSSRPAALGPSAEVRRESRRSRVPAGRIHFARGCSIKKGTPRNRRFRGDGGDGGTRTLDLTDVNRAL